MNDCSDPQCTVEEQLYGLIHCKRCDHLYCQDHIGTHVCVPVRRTFVRVKRKEKTYVPPIGDKCPECGTEMVVAEGYQTCSRCNRSYKTANTIR